MLDVFKSRLGAAVIIGCLFVFGVVMLTSPKAPRPTRAAVGTLTELVGEADARAPESLNFEAARSGRALVSGEQIVTRAASQATLTFSGGAQVRLQPGARLVAEKTPEGVLATLIEGDADVLNAGAQFKLIKNGRDITRDGSRAGSVDKMNLGDARASVVPSNARPAGEPALVTASVPLETSPPEAAKSESVVKPDVNSNANSDANSKDSLSNDEIRRAMSAETGFYRRCYLTYLNRAKIEASSVRSSRVTVGFTIANSGKVRDARIVRSDFNDATLNACILETVERTPFRAFRAGDIPVLEFPIELK